MAFCRNCGTQMNGGAKFCPKCGQSTDGSPTSQQQYIEQPQEEEHGFVYKMWHSKWNWIGAIAFLIVILAANTCGSDTEMLQKEVEKMMVEKMKENGNNLNISSFTLVHQNGNNYIGIASCTFNGEKVDLDVKVVYDGSNIQAEWEPTIEYKQKALEEGLRNLFKY